MKIKWEETNLSSKYKIKDSTTTRYKTPSAT